MIIEVSVMLSALALAFFLSKKSKVIEKNKTSIKEEIKKELLSEQEAIIEKKIPEVEASIDKKVKDFFQSEPTWIPLFAPTKEFQKLLTNCSKLELESRLRLMQALVGSRMDVLISINKNSFCIRGFSSDMLDASELLKKDISIG